MAAVALAVPARAQSATVAIPAEVPVAGPKVTQIDAVSLKQLVKPNGRPLLVNFWATWCDPCREEFPELVKVDEDYRGKINFITVTMDEPSDILTAVPRFLLEMKAQMPTYLLKTPDEDTAIAGIASGWRGGLPFTLLYRPDGSVAYFRQGKVFPAPLRAEIDKLLTPALPPAAAKP
jgi:thiol-disulfide isomerase/thioredoxin